MKMSEPKEVSSPLPDQIDRDLASGEDKTQAALKKNVFIEAGAGTGKTETIVRRIVNQLYVNPELDMSQVAAITFTEKAAAELRARFRKILTADIESDRISLHVRGNQLLQNLDTASIGTIHAFAKNILTDHSVAAGIPMGFRIANETSSESLRVSRSRNVVSNAYSSLSARDKEIFYEIGFDSKLMQEMVELMDQKFTRLVGGFKIDEASNTEDHQVAAISFLKNCYQELNNEMEQRLKSGNIEFDDLLVLALRLLQNEPQVRELVHNKIQILVVDEFQDTDPVQWEIIKLVTSSPADSSRKPLPGRLVVVGDPKQAIYAFRGGDINTYLAARNEFPEFGIQLQLSSNFRSVKGILKFVNHAFRDDVAPDTQNPLNMGVDYKALANIHDPEHEVPGPAVLLLNNPPEEFWVEELGLENPDVKAIDKAKKAFDYVAFEMQNTALAIRRAVDEQWQVTDRGHKMGYQRVYSRPANYGDVCLLVPVRTHLKTLLKEFEAAGVPYRSTDPSIVYNRPLIAGIRDVIAVVAKSDDQAKIWGALKSPLFGFSDQALFDHKQAGGYWNIGKGLKDGLSDVNSALELLHELSEISSSKNPAWLIAELLRRLSIYQVLSKDEFGDFESSCLRMVIAHSQEWLSDGNIGLLSYLDWVNTMLSESTRASLPDADDLDANAVQIMTVHASKGLEFPITVVTGLASTMKAERPKLLFHRAESGGDQRLEFTLIRKDYKSYFESKGYQELKSGEHFASIMEELSRLIYVACTRAKDHLILSTIAEPSSETSSTPSRGKRLNQAMDFINSYFEDFAGYEVTQKDSQGTPISYREISMEELERVDHVRKLSVEPVMRAPSTHQKKEASSKDFKKSFAKDEESPDGRPLGRAVHGVMELIMLGSGMPTQSELDNYISQSVAKEQAEEVLEEIKSRISCLLANADILEALSSSLKWPELHLAKQVNEGSIRFVEGFADLVYKAADGYVLVDYKTDSDLEVSMAHYEEQLGAYADILKDIIGEPVARVLIVHAKTNEAVTWHLPLTK
jgi:ATP-dependent helicase/nuclease subunit A